jgi:hypothetical protein
MNLLDELDNINVAIELQEDTISDAKDRIDWEKFRLREAEEQKAKLLRRKLEIENQLV